MKMKILLAVALLLNLVLAALLAFRGKPLPPNAASDHRTAPTAPASAPADRQVVKPATVPGSTAPATFDWRAVESDDYRKYIANLRAIGCPEKTIRDIIVADVNELFRERAKGQVFPTNRFEYWKGGNRGTPLGNMFNEEMLVKQQELSKEKRELLKALLGDNAPTGLDLSPLADSQQQMLAQMLDFLPADKLTPLIELEQTYRARLMKQMPNGKLVDPTAIRKILAEKDAEMLQLLSPEQKFEYDLRMSRTAMGMRTQMGDFEPTEEQFRDMFKAQKAFDDQFKLTGKNETVRRDAAQKELEAEIRSILGENGYRTYTFEQQWTYDPLKAVAKENNISKAIAFKVFDLQKEAQAQAAKVKGDQTLSPEQRAAALSAMRTETELAIAQVLGSTAAQAYLKRADWIKRMGL